MNVNLKNCLTESKNKIIKTESTVLTVRGSDLNNGLLKNKMNPTSHCSKYNIPSFSSKRGQVTEKHVLIGCKHDMFGNQTFEV